jgi:hypothetical protein
MASTTFNGPVRSEKGFQVATKNSSTGAVTTRMSSGMPDLTGLSISDVATACTLPAATQGSVVVYAQAKDTTGGTATLSFDCAGTDAYATGSVIESRGSSEVTFDTSASGETLLTFTPANAATNLFTTGSMIAFICYEKGTWHIASKMGGAADATTGAFLFAS